MSTKSTIPARTANVWGVRLPNRCWAVRVEGSKESLFMYRTPALAIAHRLTLARNHRCELIIQNRGPRVRERNRDGNDPYPPQGLSKELALKLIDAGFDEAEAAVKAASARLQFNTEGMPTFSIQELVEELTGTGGDDDPDQPAADRGPPPPGMTSVVGRES